MQYYLLIIYNKKIIFTLEEGLHFCKCGVFGVCRIQVPYDFVEMDNAPPPGTFVQCPPADKAIKDLRPAKFLLVQ